MKKIVTIIGARPQFVKAAVVSRVFANNPDIEEIIVHTGQHFDENMSEIFFEEMNIPQPLYNLGIHSLSHGAMTGKMMEEVEKILLKENPDWVLVYGDTNSTLAGALTAKKLGIKVAHVEAGLRSFNMDMPEEINRILTDRVSNLLFTPTRQATDNLKKEAYGNFSCEILETGDVMFDAVLFYQQRMRKPAYPIPDKFVLCTLHRAENTDNPENLKDIFDALGKIAETCPIVFPIHPRTKEKLAKEGNLIFSDKIHFIPPVGYMEMLWLTEHAELVMTDSGGLQKEAYFFEKYCITLREETEWIELVENGFNLVTGSNPVKIMSAFNLFYNKEKENFGKKLYGNGNAANKILEGLLAYPKEKSLFL